MHKNPKNCPKCGSDRVVPILFGYPSPDAIEAAQCGEIIFGGCCPSLGGDPDYQCRDCGAEFFENGWLADPPDSVEIAPAADRQDAGD